MLYIRQERSKEDRKVILVHIYLTKEDSAYITLDLTDGSGNPLVLTENDVIRCQVRKAPDGGDILFEGIADVDDDGICWHITPSDTENVEVGEYFWDGQIEYAETGDVFSFVPVSPFTVMSQVTEEVEGNG